MPIEESKVQEHYRVRIKRLTRVLEGVQAERELAMYRAHQHGVPVDEIAHLALAAAAEVEQEIDLCKQDPYIDGLTDGPDWVEFWRHDGWRISA